MATDFASALVSRNYSAAIKHLDAEIKHALAHNGSTVHQLLCNRAYCYEQLQLHRRASKVDLYTATVGEHSSLALDRRTDLTVHWRRTMKRPSKGLTQVVTPLRTL